MKATAVLVIRGDDSFSFLLRNGGCEVINLELIITAPAADLSGLDERISKLNDYDGLFFTSPAAVEVFAERCKTAGMRFDGNIYVLGRRAKLVLEDAGFDVVYRDEANTAEELISSFDDSEFETKKLLFVMGDKSLRTIPDALGTIAEVNEVIVYETQEKQPNKRISDNIKEKLKLGEINRVCFFSPSGVEIFLRHFGVDVTANLKTAAIGKSTARKAEELKMQVDFIAEKATAEDFAAGLLQHIKSFE